MYLRRDSNSYAFRHWLLRPACMPFHHSRIIGFWEPNYPPGRTHWIVSMGGDLASFRLNPRIQLRPYLRLDSLVYLKTWSRYYESNVDLKFRKLLFYPLNYSEKYLAGPAGIEPTSLSSKHSILSVELKALNWIRKLFRPVLSKPFTPSI